MIAKLSFKTSWIFGGNGKNCFSIERFIRCCQEEFNEEIKIRESSSNNCVLEIPASCPPDDIKARMENIIHEKILHGTDDDGVFQLTVSDEQESVSTKKSAEAPKSAKAPESSESTLNEVAEEKASTEKQSTIITVDALTGAENFKALCHEIHETASYICAHKTQSVFFSDAYLFSVNPGGGYSHALDLLSDLLFEDGIFDKKKNTAELTPPSPSNAELHTEMGRFISSLNNILSSPRIVSIDISEWINHTSHSDFKQMLLYIFRKNSNCLIAFHTPSMNQNALDSTCSDLNDIINTRPVVFKPFSESELRELAENMLKNHGYTVADDAWSIFDLAIENERHDGYFYGVHTVRKIAYEMLRYMERHVAKTGSDDKHITKDVIAPLTPAKKAEGVTGLQMLDALIGMDEIKNQVRETVNQIMLARSQKMRVQPCMHMRFVGNPGTGKTTVARIIGKILADNGVLRLGKFFEHHGRDLCGSFVGHTAPKTTNICREAYGSVLFIDEAYSLFRSEGSGRDYGQEAIDTLIAEMENKSDDLIVIFAGYPDDMDTLMTANAGMASRVPYTINFPNYSREQLMEIFLQMASEYFTFGEDFRKNVEEYFLSLSESVITSRSFGNARFCRNLYERVWSKAALRCEGLKPDSIVLTPEDLQAAIHEIESSDPQQKPPIKLGFN